MPHSQRYIVCRDATGFAHLIIGPIIYPLTSRGYNQRRDGASHIQAMRESNRQDIAYHRAAGDTVTIERTYPALRQEPSA